MERNPPTARYEQAIADARFAPILPVGALALDLLAIHPSQDGNGRVARLLTMGELLRHGFGVARYVSIEQRIFESKHAYHEALRASQVGWHETEHDLWPWLGSCCASWRTPTRTSLGASRPGPS